MSERKDYNGEAVKTADGVVIKEGLRVFTNNLDTGIISLDRAEFEWHGPEQRWVLWFDVLVDHDYKGNPVDTKVLQSDDRVATRFQGKRA